MDESLRSKPLTRGPKWLQNAFNELREDIKANRAVSGLGASVHHDPGGSGRQVSAFQERFNTLDLEICDEGETRSVRFVITADDV